MLTVPNPAQSQAAMWSLAEALYPIHRTLVNAGFDRSLGILGEQLELSVLEYPSGQPVWDWVIPPAWNVVEAYIADSGGRHLVDFKDNNLHLSAYSRSHRGRVAREDLLRHLRFLKDQPDAIPYNFLYYRDDWEFNIAYNRLTDFTDGEYFVNIEVERQPGTLKVGEAYLPGHTRNEILISTYMCHPSLANDNVSGVVVAVELFKLLRALPAREYSYRLLILPETIGSIAYLAHHQDALATVVGGYTIYICGDRGGLTYKQSYPGDALVDRAARHVLEHYFPGSRVRPFTPTGSDERQYNAPGVRLPVGALTRTPPGEFKEYHTSLDDLSVISPEALLETLSALYHILGVLEKDRIYLNHYKGEPFYTKHGFVYPSYHDDRGDRAQRYCRILAMEVDGQHSLLDIAEKWQIPLDELSAVADQFLQRKLISLRPEAGPQAAL